MRACNDAARLLLRSQQARKVVLDLIPTGNGLRPSFAQPVGEVVP